VTRRALYGLIGGMLAILILRIVLTRGGSTGVVAAEETVATAEERLDRVKQMASLVPGRESQLKQAGAELKDREKGLLNAPTAEQAKAQLLDIIHRVAASNQIDARGLEQSNVKALGADYAEVSVGIAFTCQIDQLVNFLAQVANQPEILATNEINISGGNDKTKRIQVRLSLSGLAPKALVPVRKGGQTF
jgi:hypothetical protein